MKTKHKLAELIRINTLICPILYSFFCLNIAQDCLLIFRHTQISSFLKTNFLSKITFVFLCFDKIGDTGFTLINHMNQSLQSKRFLKIQGGQFVY